MSLFPILPLQVRDATPDASVPDTGTPRDATATPDAPSPEASTPPALADGGTPVPDASAGPDAGAPASSRDASAHAPRADAGSPPADGGLSGDTQSFYVSVVGGYGWRGFGNSAQDTHEGPYLSLTVGYPTLRIGSQWSLRPEFLYRHEWMGRDMTPEFGPGWRSSADLDTLGLGAVLEFDPHPLFGIMAGFHLGLTHLGANAPMDGRGGIRYSDNRFGYSANDWAFDAEAHVRLGVPEQRIADGFYLGGGAEGHIGYNAFSLTPDSPSRPVSDPAIGIGSVNGGIGLYLSGRFGAPPARSPSPAPEAPSPARPAEAPAPVAPPTVETPAPVAPPPPASAARVSRAAFTVAPNEEGLMIAVRDEEGFQTFFNQRVRSAAGVRSAMEPARAVAYTLTLSVRYGTQSRGSVAVESLRVGETTYRNGHFPPDMPVSTSTLEAIIRAVGQALPAYTGSRGRPLEIQITHNPADEGR